MYGPEPWRTVAGAEWSYWDLWFCTVCVVYHDGDWDALDAAIQGADRSDGEAKWSHLLSLTERLRHAGLNAGDLAATADDRKVRAKARAKVMKSTLYYERDRTPAMSTHPRRGSVGVPCSAPGRSSRARPSTLTTRCRADSISTVARPGTDGRRATWRTRSSGSSGR